MTRYDAFVSDIDDQQLLGITNTIIVQFIQHVTAQTLAAINIL